MPDDATSATTVAPPAPPPAAAPAAPLDDDKRVPIARLNEISTQRDTARADAAAAAARADAAEARLRDMERTVSRLGVRADLSIDDDDDADRVLSVWEKAHPDPKKRPKVAEWVKSEGVLDTLPKSIRTAYGQSWGAAVEGQPPAAPGARSAPQTNRGAQPAPASSAADPYASMTREERLKQAGAHAGRFARFR